MKFHSSLSLLHYAVSALHVFIQYYSEGEISKISNEAELLWLVKGQEVEYLCPAGRLLQVVSTVTVHIVKRFGIHSYFKHKKLNAVVLILVFYW